MLWQHFSCPSPPKKCLERQLKISSKIALTTSKVLSTPAETDYRNHHFSFSRSLASQPPLWPSQPPPQYYYPLVFFFLSVFDDRFFCFFLYLMIGSSVWLLDGPSRRAGFLHPGQKILEEASRLSRRRKFLGGGGESNALRSTYFTYFFFREKKIIKFRLDSSPCVFLRDECLFIGRAREGRLVSSSEHDWIFSTTQLTKRRRQLELWPSERGGRRGVGEGVRLAAHLLACLLYTSDAADE